LVAAGRESIVPDDIVEGERDPEREREEIEARLKRKRPLGRLAARFYFTWAKWRFERDD
jgi:hypothetical protein